MPIQWVIGVYSSLKLCSSLFFYHSICVSLLLLVILCLHMYFLLFTFLNFTKIEPLTSNDQTKQLSCRNQGKGWQGCSPKKSLGITSHASGSAKKCEGMNPHIPK